MIVHRIMRDHDGEVGFMARKVLYDSTLKFPRKSPRRRLLESTA